VQKYDGSDCAEWTRSAHIAWLTWIIVRLGDSDGIDAAIVETLFTRCPEYGWELVEEARHAMTVRRIPNQYVGVMTAASTVTRSK
jgi:hypothetical protein